MFYLYHSNDLELLKGLLINTFQQQPVGPFEQEAILVQSQGMAHWLKLQLAQELGVAAQVEFPLPSKFIWQVFNSLNPQLPQRTYFDKQIMAWRLMQLLPQLATEPECQLISHYLQDETAAISALKCYQLAQNIADTFDQYLIYRPQWLLDWEQGSNRVDEHELGVHAWQPVVWRALVAATPAKLADGSLPREHRGRVHLQLQELVANNAQALHSLPKRLFVFGIAALPKVYWQVLQAISTQIDVHFYLQNPSNEFWSDIVSTRQALKALRQRQPGLTHSELGNPLLASWGKLGREFLNVLQNSQGIQEFELFYAPPEQSSNLLSWVQQDILNLHNRTEQAASVQALSSSRFKQGIDPQDQSIRLISAHSPLREVQRLYDQILYWLDHDPELKPRDIVVMVPDINQYAPYIDAVFASHQAQLSEREQRYRIPWAIADQAVAKEDPIINSFLTLLALPDSRFLNTDILDLLAVPAIARRFELTAEDLETLQSWLVQAEVRWGLDGKQRQQLGLPNFEQNSWRQGLKQLLLGTMLPNSALTSDGYQGDFPVFAAEGNNSERLGKLVEFIDQLEQYSQQLSQQNLSPQHWQQLISELLEQFYAAEEQELHSLQTIRQALVSWQEDCAMAELTDELNSAVVAAWFNDHLSMQTGWQRFLAGPVNFCSLMPMRSIPFKAVCMLGMNDTDYPRRVSPLGFDLIQRFPQAGDRARREDDRYLFLEALCAAQQYLYLSYRGHDVRETSEQQPSVLVAELRDYLADGFCLQDDLDLPHQQSRQQFLAWLQEELPLQPYHQDAFIPQHPRAIRSYQQLWAQVAQVGESEELQAHNWPEHPLDIPADLNPQVVPWQDVIEALTAPAKFFVTRRLQTRLERSWEEQEPEVNEPFAIDGLTKYHIQQRWFERRQSALQQPLAQEAQLFTRQQQALGYLPVNELGLEAGEKMLEQVNPLIDIVLPILTQPLDNRGLDYQLGEQQLLGELQQAYWHPDYSRPVLVFYRFGKVRGQHLFAAWLQLLLASLQEQQPIQQAVFYSLEEKGVQKTTLNAPTTSQTQQLVQQAVAWYWQCWQQPIAHLPDSLWEAMNSFKKLAENDKLDDQERSEKQQDCILELLDKEFGELNNLYVQRCLGHFLSELPEHYAQWLEDYGELLQALLEHQQVEIVEEAE